MKTRIQLISATVLLTAALASSPVSAQQVRESADPASPAICNTLRDAARARFNEVWVRTWQTEGFAQLHRAAVAVLDGLTSEERKTLENYRNGTASSWDVHPILFDKLKLARSVSSDGTRTSARLVGWDPVILSIQVERGFSSRSIWFSPNEPFTREVFDDRVMSAFRGKVSAELRIPSGKLVHNADEYVREYAGIPESCREAGPVPHSVNEADSGSSQPDAKVPSEWQTEPAGETAI